MVGTTRSANVGKNHGSFDVERHRLLHGRDRVPKQVDIVRIGEDRLSMVRHDREEVRAAAYELR